MGKQRGRFAVSENGKTILVETLPLFVSIAERVMRLPQLGSPGIETADTKQLEEIYGYLLRSCLRFDCLGAIGRLKHTVKSPKLREVEANWKKRLIQIRPTAPSWIHSKLEGSSIDYE